MACRRCSNCGISYPYQITKCQVCGEATAYMGGMHDTVDSDWEEKVKLANSVGRPADYELNDQERLVAWRLEQLLVAGYDPPDAVELAANPLVDLHRATNMRAEGCPSDVALKILL